MRTFSVTWDYRCPFARNAAEHVVVGLAAGAEWEVTWVPFSLNQVHVEDDGTPVWDDPSMADALYPMLAGIAVHDRMPAAFPAVHMALFAARHDQGRDLRDRAVVHDTLSAAGADADAVRAEIETGGPMDRFRAAHESAVADHRVFGVPTFVSEGSAAFVRLMHRPEGDGERAIATVERVLDLVAGWSDLNELKHTTVPR